MKAFVLKKAVHYPELTGIKKKNIFMLDEVVSFENKLHKTLRKKNNIF